jgi:hypothetical protein
MSDIEFWSKRWVWIATIGELSMAVNALRSLTAPVAFAAYLGLPLAHVFLDSGILLVVS